MVLLFMLEMKSINLLHIVALETNKFILMVPEYFVVLIRVEMVILIWMNLCRLAKKYNFNLIQKGYFWKLIQTVVEKYQKENFLIFM